MAILIVLLGVVTIARMSTDIFPAIDIPVVSVIWSYAGGAPEEMEGPQRKKPDHTIFDRV